MRDDFVARATELGAVVHVLENRQEAVTTIAGLCSASGARKVALGCDLGDFREPLVEAVVQAGAQVATEGESPREIATFDVGVTRARLGIAETGTVVLAGDDSLARMASMLPLVHVVVLDSGMLVPTLDEAGEYLCRVSMGPPGDKARYVSLVSGPSRTSDVEKTLTVGVHGPGQLHIILLP